MTITNEFYLAVMNRLIDKVPELQYFDWMNRQLESEEEDMPFNFPAVFFEYAPITWTSQGKKRQVASVNFRLYVAIESLMERSSQEEEKNRTGALNDFNVLDSIFSALQGYNGNGSFGSIGRIEEAPDHDHDQLNVPVLTFRVRLIDNAAQPETKKLTGVSFGFVGKFYKKPEEEEEA